jgi:hypothetical protein
VLIPSKIPSKFRRDWGYSLQAWGGAGSAGSAPGVGGVIVRRLARLACPGAGARWPRHGGRQGKAAPPDQPARPVALVQSIKRQAPPVRRLSLGADRAGAWPGWPALVPVSGGRAVVDARGRQRRRFAGCPWCGSCGRLARLACPWCRCPVAAPWWTPGTPAPTGSAVRPVPLMVIGSAGSPPGVLGQDRETLGPDGLPWCRCPMAAPWRTPSRPAESNTLPFGASLSIFRYAVTKTPAGLPGGRGADTD